jgi:hypothetical protein
MGQNANPSDLPSEAWTAADAPKAVAIAYDLADTSAGRAADWYTNAMRRRGRIARAIRLVALVFFGIGGVVPIARGLLDVLPALPAKLAWNDVGYISLAVGAGLLGFDHFFGISSAYTRFVTTEVAIRNARARFHVDWLVLLSECDGLKPDALKPFVERLKEFVSLVLQLVERETQEWVAEFRSSLTELEKLQNRMPRGAARAPETRPPGQPSAGPRRNGGTEGTGLQPPTGAIVADGATVPGGHERSPGEHV